MTGRSRCWSESEAIGNDSPIHPVMYESGSQSAFPRTPLIMRNGKEEEEEELELTDSFLPV